MSLFTQWVPHTWSDAPRRSELDAYADRVVNGYTKLAPNFKRSVIHRKVIGPYEMEHDYGLMGGNRRILRDRKRAGWSRRGGR